MKKMRSKKDRRPLLRNETPVFSDQAPGIAEEQAKKGGSWKRLFGGGKGSGSNSGSRQKDDYSRYSSVGENGEASNNKNHRIDQTSPSVFDGVEHSQRLPRVLDKRDDATKSSLNNCDVTSTPTTSNFTESTKKTRNNGTNSSNRNKNRSSSKKISGDQLLSSSSLANGSVVSQQQVRECNRVISCQHEQENQNWVTSATTSNEASVTDDDVKKILSRPFGREHILTTEQIVSYNFTELLVNHV